MRLSSSVANVSAEPLLLFNSFDTLRLCVVVLVLGDAWAIVGVLCEGVVRQLFAAKTWQVRYSM